MIGLTGCTGGKLLDMADVCIRVDETETYKIQELHLPVYHCLCLMLEERFFGLWIFECSIVQRITEWEKIFPPKKLVILFLYFSYFPVFFIYKYTYFSLFIHRTCHLQLLLHILISAEPTIGKFFQMHGNSQIPAQDYWCSINPFAVSRSSGVVILILQ